MYPHREQVDKILKSNEKRPVFHTLDLPCGCGQVEITQPRDQLVTCPACKKTQLFIYSMLNPKWQIQ